MSFSRNVTIPETSWEQQCRDVESVRQNCETNYRVENVTKTEQICNDIMVKECYNYTVPTYSVVCSDSIFAMVFKCFQNRLTRKSRKMFPLSLRSVSSETLQNSTVIRFKMLNTPVARDL